MFLFDVIAGTESVLGENTTFVSMDCVFTESSVLMCSPLQHLFP